MVYKNIASFKIWRIIDTCYGWMPMVFSKNKSLPIVPFFSLKLPWPEYFMAVKSVFDIECFKDVKFWVEQSVLHYNI